MNTAVVFPGQGSQKVGMGLDMYQNYAESREVFDKASRALGIDMASLCFDGPEEELKKTVNAQPAILTVCIACYKAMQHRGLEPQVVAGHSLGEYTALVAAGAISFEDAVKLVKSRGKYMQDAVPLGDGGMVAVLGLEVEKVIEICSDISKTHGVVEAVNLNSPGQVVVAGDNIALSRAVEQLNIQGARRCISLPVSAPFHSSMMKPAGDKLEQDLSMINISEPCIPVLSNVTAHYHGKPDDIKSLLIRQVYSPVLWEECVRRLISDGVNTFVEVGPGKVLSGLIKKISPKASVFNMEDRGTLENIIEKQVF